MHIHGFTLKYETTVPELSSTARMWIHDKTDAEVLSFTNTDENKVFGVSFRTPPADSTGVAHILEHSVLCGSKKYPVKEPFVELLKGSLQTFLNAFTYPDKTCYPVASCNLKDFRNLTDVYLDAVFFPRISEAIFQQEGWHLEADEVTGPLSYKGVVYNEMKGAFSSPESILSRHCLHALFPDTVYGLESGGDPEVIPSLTYENFLAFHRDYYHPSNARFFFWGDDPEEDRLAQLSSTLESFSPKTIGSDIGLQTALKAPRIVKVPFAANQEDKLMAVVNWLGPEVTDIELTLGFRMLEHILLGMPASPLRRALIESGLGEDLAGQGLETELRQLTFDIGLKGMAPGTVPQMEALIYDTLNNLVSEGISPGAIEAAVNSIEFRLRENNSGRFPVGLSVMLQSLTTWLHNADPLSPLRFEEPLAVIKKKIAAQEGYFEQLIKDWLLHNTHRVTVVLEPELDLAAKTIAREQDKLQAISDSLTSQQRADVVENTKVLHAWQAMPDSAEALATIPRLSINDLAKKNSLIPQEQLTTPAHTLYHPLPTGGIAYVEAYFSLHNVPLNLFPLLPLFGRAIFEIGSTNHDFVALNMAIAQKTGGMEAYPLFLTHMQHQTPLARLVVSGKAAPDKVHDLFALLREVLLETCFDDKARFLSMVLEEKARQEHSLIPSGHTVVASRLRSKLCPTGLLAEQTNGVESLLSLRVLAQRVENDWTSVLNDLKLLQQLIFTQSNLELNITALPEHKTQLHSLASNLTSALPVGKANTKVDWLYGGAGTAPEALILPAQVNYMGKGVNLFTSGYTWHGSASVVLKYLRTGYLWEKVRVQGGAYGCLCSMDRSTGVFLMASYRDPNTMKTLQIFDGTAEHLLQKPLSKEDLQAAIIGAIGELDTYMLPDAKGSTSFLRQLAGDDESRRQTLREEILSTTQKHITMFAEALESLSSQGLICGLGGAQLESEAQKHHWEVRTVL